MMRHLAEMVATRDASTKTDAIEVLLEALQLLDAVDHADLARALCPIDYLAFALTDAIEEQREKAAVDCPEDETRIDETARARIEELERRCQALQGQLDAHVMIIDDYSDALAMARKFVTTASRAGLRTRHARAVKSSKKPRKAGTS